MIIGYDAKRAALNATGLGNYSRLVIDLMSQALPEAKLRLYTPRRGDLYHEKLGMEYVVPGRWWRPMSGAWRMERGVTNDLIKSGVNLYHGLSGELPLDIKRANVPSVVTIHDLIFRKMPRCYKAVDRAMYDFKFSNACRNASRIMAISERTKQDIMEIYGVPERRIDVVYQGCHQIFSEVPGPEEIARVRSHYHLPERYIIALATLEQRKNQRLAINALKGLPEDVILVLAGRPRDSEYKKELIRTIYRNDVGDRVKFLHEVPFDALPGLYGGSVFASYTSRYEGFGLPVVEALLSGVPVIAATGSCLEEAGGPGAIYVNPDDVDQYVAEARRLLDDSDLRQQLVKAGQEHAQKFSAKNFTQGLLDCYHKAGLKI